MLDMILQNINIFKLYFSPKKSDDEISDNFAM